jgi:WD40 repeat protein
VKEFATMNNRVRLTPLALLGGFLGLSLAGPAFPNLNQQLPPAKAAGKKAEKIDEQEIRNLITQLGDRSFQVREAADRKLEGLGESALMILRETADGNVEPEIHHRAVRLVKAIDRALFNQVRVFDGRHDSWSTRVQLTPDGTRAVSSGPDGLRSWDVATGKAAIAFGQRDQGYWSLAVSTNGELALAGGPGGFARLFDLKTGGVIQTFVGHKGAVWGAALTADGKRAVTGAYDKTIRVWDVATGNEIKAMDGVTEQVRCLALSPDGRQVAGGVFAQVNGPGRVQLWDLETGKLLQKFRGQPREISSVTFSPDGKTLLSSGFDRTVRLWDVADGKELKRFEGNLNRVEYAVFTPDGRRVLSCGNEKNPTVRVWDIATGKLLHESEETPGGFLAVAALPDNRHCVTAGRDGSIRLWRWVR